MLKKLINALPKRWLVALYKHTPFQGFKNTIVAWTQPKYVVAVLGVITNDQGQVLLLNHRYRTKQPWGIPGGFLELEQPEIGFKREIEEETGLMVRIRLARALFGTKPTRIDLIYRGEVLRGTFRPNEEIAEIRFCTPGEWPDGMPGHQKQLILDVIANPSREV
ncbi:NUDIX hydrolase [Paenibacillus koleovorans]|uniref:NUDIX hydrolase n=1 Tax=Paenibacillus koleovorans TaxID=121608 RepID=UPI000FD6E40A|nr:NUDIX hydrolase [Paenibacillus koleovorans]